MEAVEFTLLGQVAFLLKDGEFKDTFQNFKMPKARKSENQKSDEVCVSFSCLTPRVGDSALTFFLCVTGIWHRVMASLDATTGYRLMFTGHIVFHAIVIQSAIQAVTATPSISSGRVDQHNPQNLREKRSRMYLIPSETETGALF
ncbi:hypothetical protein RRG08_001061 [Elysia crispata]|uniref:Uncharacterized protein n=1 Tax=Elysia crispata TaxID=231223 RepID=A0AAE1AVY9_9GAST|nr:hypothetical protein RRG08_001061 [Elysia crispata]